MEKKLDYKSGVFYCPKCGYKKFNKYTNWLSRIEYIKGIPQTKYIFYRKKNKCACCLCCFLCSSNDISFYSCFVQVLKCKVVCVDIIFFPCYLLCNIFYLLFCSIADFFNLCCCRYEEYEDVCEYIYLEKEYDNESKKFKEGIEYYLLAKKEGDIWKLCKGFTETEWKEFKIESRCAKCGNITDTFSDFIEKKDISVISNQPTSTDILNEPPIAVNIGQQASNYTPIVCKLSDKFSSVQKKYFDKNPELKTELKSESQFYVFLVGGIKLEPNKTLEEQGVKDGENIIMNIMDNMEN